METQFYLVLLVFFNIIVNTCVHSDWAKTIIITFVLEIINIRRVSKTTFTRGGYIQVNAEMDKNLSVFVCSV